MNQWYANNTTIKFPLDPFHEGPVPDDILVDMALSVPNGTVVYLTNMIITEKFIFMSLEAADGSAVGHIMQQYPSVSAIVQLDMTADGFGWVTFGPGVLEYPRSYKDIRIKLDDSVILPEIEITNPFNLIVDGKSYPRPAVLNIRPLDYMGSVETDDILRLIRADDRLTGNMNIILFTSQEYDENVLTNLNGVAPDEDGDIMLSISVLPPATGSALVRGILRVADSERIGLLIETAGVEDCGDEQQRLDELLLCRTEYGITWALPLDDVNCDPSIICPE